MFISGETVNQMSFSSKPSKYKSWPANTHKMELFRQLLPNTHQSTLFVGKIARKLPICVSLKTAIFPFNIGKNRIYMNLPSLLISWTIRGLGSHLIPHLLWFQWLRIWHLSRILAPARFSKLEPGKFLESMRKLYLQWIFIRKKNTQLGPIFIPAPLSAFQSPTAVEHPNILWYLIKVIWKAKLIITIKKSSFLPSQALSI